MAGPTGGDTVLVDIDLDALGRRLTVRGAEPDAAAWLAGRGFERAGRVWIVRGDFTPPLRRAEVRAAWVLNPACESRGRNS